MFIPFGSAILLPEIYSKEIVGQENKEIHSRRLTWSQQRTAKNISLGD